MSNRLLQEDYNKYGEENFIFEIIEEVEDNDDMLIEKENFYMDKYKTYVLKYGYDFGYNLHRAVRRVFTEENKKAMSDALKGKNIGLSLEECLKIKELLLDSKREMIKDKIKEVSEITSISERTLGKISRGEYCRSKELLGGYKDWIGFNKYDLYVKIKEEIDKDNDPKKDCDISKKFNVSRNTVRRLRIGLITLQEGKIIMKQ